MSLVDDDYHELLLNSYLKTHEMPCHGEHSLCDTSSAKKPLQILHRTSEVQMDNRVIGDECLGKPFCLVNLEAEKRITKITECIDINLNYMTIIIYLLFCSSFTILQFYNHIS